MLFLSVNQVGSGQLSVTALKWKKGFVLSTGPLTTWYILKPFFIVSSPLFSHEVILRVIIVYLHLPNNKQGP